jgi:hypothetical protein
MQVTISALSRSLSGFAAHDGHAYSMPESNYVRVVRRHKLARTRRAAVRIIFGAGAVVSLP